MAPRAWRIIFQPRHFKIVQMGRSHLPWEACGEIGNAGTVGGSRRPGPGPQTRKARPPGPAWDPSKPRTSQPSQGFPAPGHPPTPATSSGHVRPPYRAEKSQPCLAELPRPARWGVCFPKAPRAVRKRDAPSEAESSCLVLAEVQRKPYKWFASSLF